MPSLKLYKTQILNTVIGSMPFQIKLTNKLLYILGIIIILIYLFPLFINGENSVLPTHDTLDYSMVKIKTLAESGKIFADNHDILTEYMNAPRSSFDSEFNILVWLFYFFKPFTAYVINQLLIRIVAFCGMTLLLKNFFLKNPEEKYIIFIAAISFSLIPFWPLGGLSIAGQPLALYAILSIKNTKFKYNRFFKLSYLKHWIILILVPLYSYLELSFIFFIIILCCYWLYLAVKSRKPNWIFLIALIFFLLMFLLTEYRLVSNLFFDRDYISHRTEFQKLVIFGSNFSELPKIMYSHFLFGQDHTISGHIYIIFIVLVVLINNALQRKGDRKLYLILGLTALFSILYGLYSWNIFIPVFETVSIFSTFNFSRFYWIQPMLWYIIYGICLKHIRNMSTISRYLIMIIFIFQISFLFSIRNKDIALFDEQNYTFSEYYSENLFKKIEGSIGDNKSSYKVASLGLQPGIARYNGFSTIDGYLVNYPLEYKTKFRKIIEKELMKNQSIKDYYDYFGNRVYIYSSELGKIYEVNKSISAPISNFEINNEEFKSLGGKYLFSTVEIRNYEKIGFKFRGVFEDNQSPWKVYLYEIK